MKKILAIMPVSIGGRLTTSSIIDGFCQDGYKVSIFDELKDKKLPKDSDFDYIVGYDFSPIEIKINNELKFPCISYFSDDINKKTSGVNFSQYKKYLKNEDIFVFYWDRELLKKETNVKNIFYQPHFVNCEIYKDFSSPKNDVLFMGRLDTDLRLFMFLELNKKLKNYSFEWYAIEKHYLDAILRCQNEEEKNILKKTYKGFIDNETDMAKAINNSKIVYNINAQGISSLNYRTIQTLACKRLVISDERMELDIFNNIIPTYKTTEDLIEKIEFYLNNKTAYENIVNETSKIVKEKLNSKISVANMLSKVDTNF